MNKPYVKGKIKEKHFRLFIKEASSMEFDQMQGIMRSERNVEVMYNGQSVWVNNIDPRTGMAQIMDNDHQNKEVSINELVPGRVIE